MRLHLQKIRSDPSVDVEQIRTSMAELLEDGRYAEACVIAFHDYYSIIAVSEPTASGQTDAVAFVPGTGYRTLSIQSNREAVRAVLLDGLGRDSPNIGEDTVQGVMQSAFDQCMKEGLSGAVIRSLVHMVDVLRERVFDREELETYPVTPAALSGNLLGKIMENTHDAVVTILGDIDDALPFLEFWNARHIRRLYCYSDDFAAAERFALTSDAIPLQSKGLRDGLIRSHLIIVASPGAYISRLSQNILKNNIGQRNTKHLLLYCWGDNLQSGPDVLDSPEVFTYGRQELEQALRQSREKRAHQLQRSADAIDEAVEEFYEWLYSGQKYMYHDMIGSSRKMQQVFTLIQRVAETDITILIQGETGTGKELVARAIHDASERQGGPFMAINCGAIPETLLEGELFGYKKGAFTGAAEDRKGLLKEAAGGTILLDEIGDTSQMFQVKLLRALQEREIIPLGSNMPIAIDVRIIAATSKQLEQEIEKGQFRADVYYRLNVVKIELPPLRERPEDIYPLAQHFLTKYSQELGKSIERITPEAMDLLARYDWQGNVRELENLVERAIALSVDRVISVEDLPEYLRRNPRILGTVDSGETIPTLEEMEEQHIRRLLTELEDNYSEVAKKLGIGRTTLWRKMKKYGLQRDT